jgi:hypothetical protein
MGAQPRTESRSCFFTGSSERRNLGVALSLCGDLLIGQEAEFRRPHSVFFHAQRGGSFKVSLWLWIAACGNLPQLLHISLLR